MQGCCRPGRQPRRAYAWHAGEVLGGRSCQGQHRALSSPALRLHPTGHCQHAAARLRGRHFCFGRSAAMLAPCERHWPLLPKIRHVYGVGTVHDMHCCWTLRPLAAEDRVGHARLALAQ